MLLLSLKNWILGLLCISLFSGELFQPLQFIGVKAGVVHKRSPIASCSYSAIIKYLHGACSTHGRRSSFYLIPILKSNGDSNGHADSDTEYDYSEILFGMYHPPDDEDFTDIETTFGANERTQELLPYTKREGVETTVSPLHIYFNTFRAKGPGKSYTPIQNHNYQSQQYKNYHINHNRLDTSFHNDIAQFHKGSGAGPGSPTFPHPKTQISYVEATRRKSREATVHNLLSKCCSTGCSRLDFSGACD